MTERTPARLVLEDGTCFDGYSFGAEGERTGEVVFNTSITGYQEILTDPSYNGQIVTMTYPLIGNYGVNPNDFESAKPQAEGFVVKEHCDTPSNYRSAQSLGDFLKERDILGIEGIDTRALTRHIRLEGAMKGVITTVPADPDELTEKAEAFTGLVGQDLVSRVTCSEPYPWSENLYDIAANQESPKGKSKYRVAAYDFGVKQNILRYLISRGCDVTVFPADTPADQLLETDPDGIFLSNGPGDPEPVHYAVENIRQIIATGKPTFGICLGHQLTGLALGASTYKLKFGHRGANQPVQETRTGKVEITSQNHGFAVSADSIDTDTVELSHINLNDNTVEGLQHKELPVFCVQYHPEASAGPHDAEYLFDRFMHLMDKHA
ncbi:TPA: carbamoyl phosphate synthase small subunit [Candidatus Latescibacteria bacterium]|nr:carbamoyl phosphate synthase small subunit [Candidatus Latescibacterota bacterium]|tara:strand:- start:214 stop:1350 length:1137 start_codon:yes stop_codon:yes gene_type:complete